MAYSRQTDDGGPDRVKRYQDFSTVDWIQDSLVERNRRLRYTREKRALLRDRPPGTRGTILWFWTQLSGIARAGQSWFIVSIVGVCIGVNAAIISIVTEWLSDLKMGYCRDGWWLNQQFCCWEIEEDEDVACTSWTPWSEYSAARWMIYVSCAASLAFIASHLVRNMAKNAAGSGISEIKCILAGVVMRDFLSFSTLVVKSITLPLIIASGLTVGKEGPSVHMACCIGNIIAGFFTRFSQSQGKLREIITAASAAGVAVAFGAPIGGVMFSIEEMTNTFSIKTMWRSFFCALVATVTLAAMNPFRTGKLVLFQVTYDRDWHFFEIIFFVILGIFGGLYGALVVQFAIQVNRFRRRYLVNYAVAEAVLLATITALIGYGNRFLRIDMTESMAILFRECEAGGDYDNLCQTSVQWRMVNSLLLATIIRIALVIVSAGCKVPAGIFVPSMAIGASFGRMVGIIVKAMYRAYPNSGIFAYCQPDVPCITPGTYAFLGAAAALSGIMRFTVTVVVIMFELTGALTYILPTMIVILVTKAVGDLLGVRGIAEEIIRFNDYPFLDKDEHAPDVPVASVMRTSLRSVMSEGMTIRDVEDLLANTQYKGFAVVSTEEKGILLGYIERTEMQWVIDKAANIQPVDANTSCSFGSIARASTPRPSHEIDGDLMPGPGIGVEESISMEILEDGATDGSIHFWPWVNQTPLTVSPHLPLEVVMQLFQRMGPRVILVEDLGRLVGLVTVKDVLHFIAQSDVHDTNEGGLGRILDAGHDWVVDAWGTAMLWARRTLRR